MFICKGTKLLGIDFDTVSDYDFCLQQLTMKLGGGEYQIRISFQSPDPVAEHQAAVAQKSTYNLIWIQGAIHYQQV